ncbi:MAG: hypothetical protein LUQ65_02855 [Candidatus Helarchaeota archaeon]|nr:hypothetical protein [Candidatus Helarchaeota archaeon]
MKIIIQFAFVILVSLLIGIYLGKRYPHRIKLPFIHTHLVFSIGLFKGNSPFKIGPHASIKQPIINCNDITGFIAEVVADPFIINENNNWYMFFEIINKNTKNANIGYATSSNGLNWKYQKIILAESFHLSYPYVFKFNNEFYMIPEAKRSRSVRLYKAIEFPEKWSLLGIILNKGYVDTSIIFFEDKWWLFACYNLSGPTTLHLFYSKDLTGPYIEHPKSPIAEGGRDARPAGRIISFQGKIVRFAQDNSQSYAKQVRAFEILKLTTEGYEEKEVFESPILRDSGQGWNADGMHHVDLHQISEDEWIACVDGYYAKKELRLF